MWIYYIPRPSITRSRADVTLAKEGFVESAILVGPGARVFEVEQKAIFLITAGLSAIPIGVSEWLRRRKRRGKGEEEERKEEEE